MEGNGNIFLSDAEKQSYQQDLANIHDIFVRPFTVFRQAERVVMSENPNFVFPYGDNQENTSSSGYVIQSGVIDARIWYMPGIAGNKELLETSSSDREFSARGEPQIRFRNDKNYVRLKLNCSGYDFINGAKTVQIDDNNFNFFTAYRRHGLFTPEFWTVWLEQNS